MVLVRSCLIANFWYFVFCIFTFSKHLSVSDCCSYKHLLLEWNTGQSHCSGINCAVPNIWLKQEGRGEASMRAREYGMAHA